MKRLLLAVIAIAAASAVTAGDARFVFVAQQGVVKYSVYERTPRGVVHVADFAQTADGFEQVASKRRYFMVTTDVNGMRSAASPDVVTPHQPAVKFRIE